MSKRYYLLTGMFILLALRIAAQPASFSPRGVGGGGALFFPRINPANDNEFYVSCDMSQLFHSTDYGDSYSQLHFNSLQSFNVSTYEFTNNPLIAYSNFNDGNSGYPVKTTDGGATWTMLPGYDASQGQVFAMKANYNNPNQVLLDYYGKIVFSNDGGVTFPVTVASAGGNGAIMGGVFFDGANIYIGTNLGLYYSTTSGSSFSLMATTGITAGNVIWQFAGAKAGATMRFTCITGANAGVYNGLMPWDHGIVTGVYSMDNAGGTWVNKTGTINLANDHVMYLGMAENDVNTVYLGGKDIATGGPLVYKTTTIGTTFAWNKVFTTTGNANIITGWEGSGGDKQWSWGEIVFGITVAPNNVNKVMFGSFSDVHLTSDGGTTWKQAYVKNTDDHPAGASTPTGRYYHSIGLENTTCWQIFWTSPNAMIGAFSDIGGIRSLDSGNTWGFTCSGMSVNSVYRIAKTPGGTLFAGTSNIHDMYQSTRLKDAQLDAADGNGKIFYSANGGANWTLLHNFGHPVFWLAIDPNDSNKMYASVVNHAGSGSAGGIWVTSNLNSLAGSSWSMLPAPPGTEGHPASVVVLNDGKVLCTFSGRISTGTTFTPSSGVFLYNPGTSSWTDVSDPGMKYWTKDIVIDPTDATQNTWYACVFTNWGSTASGQGGLYRTTNRGTSWTKLTGSTFDRVTSITFDPANSNRAYLTTEMQGLWMSNNISATIPAWSLVSSYPFRQPERVYFNPFNTGEMWVSSFGNGMKIGSSATTGAPVFANNEAGIKVYPNPVINILNVVLPQKNTSLPVSIYNIAGQLVVRLVPGSQNEIRVNTDSWPAGMYWIYYDGQSAKFIKE